MKFTVDIEAQPEFLSGSWLIEITEASIVCTGDEEPNPIDDETLTSPVVQNGDQVLIENLFENEEPGFFDGKSIMFEIQYEDGECTFTKEA